MCQSPAQVPKHVYGMSEYFVWCRQKRALLGGRSQGVLIMCFHFAGGLCALGGCCLLAFVFF